jgi:hypothetical protein
MTDDPTPRPDVTVLIAVRNGQPYVEAAIRSIMAQTLRNIEILVIDDASTDSTPEVLARLAAEDPRLRVETLRENLRLPRALNHGLALARAPYVARMDADDIAHPTRLAVQKRYLDAHPDVALCGTSYRQIDADGKYLRTTFRPRDDAANRWIARFSMPLTHPTFMVRPRDADGNLTLYDPTWSVAEDYDYLVRVMQRGKVVSLPDVLLDYRVHGSSVTGKNWALQKQQMRQISERHMTQDLGPESLAALGPFRAALFDFQPQDPAALFAGMRAMIAADARRNPDPSGRRTRWMRRQAAQLILRAMQRSGRSKAQIARAFLTQGGEFTPALALRGLELARVLPGPLRTDPEV